jgi:hypothetical protein
MIHRKKLKAYQVERTSDQNIQESLNFSSQDVSLDIRGTEVENT